MLEFKQSPKEQNMLIPLHQNWSKALRVDLESTHFKNLKDQLKASYKKGPVFPEPTKIFQALNSTPLQNVKVVILGQDPYHTPGQAQGLSFSSPAELKNPPSLQNIFKELEAELGHKSEAELKFNGDLSFWAQQGVLLLNSVLTVEANRAGSHAKIGWEKFTDQVIKTVSNQNQHVVFMLWGNFAKSKAPLIDSQKHLILTAPHPSPFSAYSGFFGCYHFKLCNQYLRNNHKDPIIW